MILVTGGTGFVGQEVVEELLALGYRVRILVHNPQSPGAVRFANNPRVQLVAGNALKPETLPAALVGVEAVIHLIGIIAETPSVTFEEAHVEAARNVLAAARQAGVTRWVQMSALGTRRNARSRYHQTKWEAEELVRQSGLDWTIFRPSLIYGYDERDRLLNLFHLALSWPADFIQLYSLPLLNGGRALIQPVSVREVAACFAHAPAKEAAIGRSFDLVGPASFAWHDMIDQVAGFFGKTTVTEEVPLLLIIRKLLWLSIVFIPCLVVAGVLLGKLCLPAAEIITALWAILIVVACRWTTTILFNVPSQPFLLGSVAANFFAPRHLHFSEQLMMAEEDNTGDPRPAAETFGYEPESFAQGMTRCYARFVPRS
ncbi:MAG: NAD(P)H-binding protein [Methylacidiphilales bacterium]|nr:NAD(P)H-binding protein [Candidatus Methylacidiphilales bacterium]